MITIHDRRDSDNSLPVSEFLDALVCHAKLDSNEMIRLSRFGGVGNRIWKHESLIDQGEQVFTNITELRDIASDSSESLEELLSAVAGVIFGLSDSSFLFMQSKNKDWEHRVAEEFQNTRSCPDRPFK